MGNKDTVFSQFTQRLGDQHHLEAAELQENEEDCRSDHGAGSLNTGGPGLVCDVFCVSCLRCVQVP